MSARRFRCRSCDAWGSSVSRPEHAEPPAIAVVVARHLRTGHIVEYWKQGARRDSVDLHIAGRQPDLVDIDASTGQPITEGTLIADVGPYDPGRAVVLVHEVADALFADFELRNTNENESRGLGSDSP